VPYQQCHIRRAVRLLPLNPLRGPSATPLAQCAALRIEIGRPWIDLVRCHVTARAQGYWLTAGEPEQTTTPGQSAPQSQRVQARCQQEGDETSTTQTQCTQCLTPYQTVVWRGRALQVRPSGHLRLATGGQRPLLLQLRPLPAPCHHTADLRRVDAPWRADYSKVCLTPDTGQPLPSSLPPAQTGGCGDGGRSEGGADRGGGHHHALARPAPLGLPQAGVYTVYIGAKPGTQPPPGAAEPPPPPPARLAPPVVVVVAQRVHRPDQCPALLSSAGWAAPGGSGRCHTRQPARWW